MVHPSDLTLSTNMADAALRSASGFGKEVSWDSRPSAIWKAQVAFAVDDLRRASFDPQS